MSILDPNIIKTNWIYPIHITSSFSYTCAGLFRTVLFFHPSSCSANFNYNQPGLNWRADWKVQGFLDAQRVALFDICILNADASSLEKQSLQPIFDTNIFELELDEAWVLMLLLFFSCLYLCYHIIFLIFVVISNIPPHHLLLISQRETSHFYSKYASQRQKRRALIQKLIQTLTIPISSFNQLPIFKFKTLNLMESCSYHQPAQQLQKDLDSAIKDNISSTTK